jgi:3-hydroxyphenylacetate 6-hydroxylase
MGTAPSSKALNKGRKDTPLGKPAVRTYIKCLDIETRTFIDQCLSAANNQVDPLHLLQRMSLSLDLTLCWGRRISLQHPLLAEIVKVEHEIVNMRNTHQRSGLRAYITIPLEHHNQESSHASPTSRYLFCSTEQRIR